jgi:type IV pilus assembly protein PilQ
VGLVSQSGMSAPETMPGATAPVQLLAVEALEGPSGTSLQVLASGPFSFTSYQPHERSVIVDLAGVVSEPGTTDSSGKVAWVADYRLLPFRNASGRRVLRLDLTLTQDCRVEVGQVEPDALLISCPGAVTAMRALEKPAPASAPAPVAVTTLPVVNLDGPVPVRQIDVQRDDGSVRVDVHSAGPLDYKVLTLDNPTRLVIDLPECVLATRHRQFAVDQDEVVGVRVGQFKADPPITRVVVDLLAMIPYEINATPEGLRVTLQSPASKVASPAAPEVLELAPTEAEAETATEESMSDESAGVLVASLAPMVPSLVSSPATTPPVAAAEPVDVAAATEAIMAPAVALAVEAASAVPPEAVAPAPAPQMMQEAPPPPAAPTGAAPPQFTGEPISVNLKDVDLKDFFRLIHEISGLNIVVDPNVSGSVTMVLLDVPWDQALDIVLKNNGLGSTLEGNVLRIATLATLKREQEEQRELAQARAEAVPPVTVTRQLSYAKADALEATLRRFLSSRGEIIRDDRTNTLIIRDIPQVIPELDNLIQQIDRKSLQVEIEARVVSASRAFSRDIGSQLATSFSTTRGRSVFGGALGASPFSSTFPPPLISADEPGAQPLVSNFRAVDPTSGFLFGHRSPNFALDVILTAAESRNIAKVLSKPRLVTQNNITAEVKQGTRIPVQTVVNNTISTQFLDVVLRLNVTPQITAEGTVFLNIVIENTAIDPGIARINGIPALATQSTTTQVLIDDGGTVVVGGVMVTNNSTNVAQVPLLGSVPIIGHLFKRTTVDTSTQELLFFITPRILPG